MTVLGCQNPSPTILIFLVIVNLEMPPYSGENNLVLSRVLITLLNDFFAKTEQNPLITLPRLPSGRGRASQSVGFILTVCMARVRGFNPVLSMIAHQ